MVRVQHSRTIIQLSIVTYFFRGLIDHFFPTTQYYILTCGMWVLISDRCHCGDYYQEKIKDIPRLHSAHFDYGASKHKD